MRFLRGMYPVIVSLSVMSALTVIVWQIKLSTAGQHRLVYFYLVPVALIAALYNGRLALLNAAIAIICADYFLQDPLYSLANDNPLEYGDLFVFALLAVTAIKFVRGMARPRAKILEARSNVSLVIRAQQLVRLVW